MVLHKSANAHIPTRSQTAASVCADLERLSVLTFLSCTFTAIFTWLSGHVYVSAWIIHLSIFAMPNNHCTAASLAPDVTTNTPVVPKLELKKLPPPFFMIPGITLELTRLFVKRNLKTPKGYFSLTSRSDLNFAI